MSDYKQRKKEFNSSTARLKKIESMIPRKEVKKKIVLVESELEEDGPKKKRIPVLVNDPSKIKGPTPHIEHLQTHIN